MPRDLRGPLQRAPQRHHDWTVRVAGADETELAQPRRR